LRAKNCARGLESRGGDDGAHLPNDAIIERAQLRGLESNGIALLGP